MSQTVRVLGHPLHAILSDFPLALLGTSLLWDALAIWRGESLWWAISFWDMALGITIALLAATIGMVDYATIDKGHPAEGTALRHMLIMLATVSLYGIALLVRGGASAPQGGRRIATLALEAVGLLLLSIGGWFGGHLVFHHGIGRDTDENMTETALQRKKN